MGAMDKRPEKKTDQERYLDLQLSLAGQSRLPDLITVGILLAVVFGFAIAGWLLPDKAMSEQENRYLQQMPVMSSNGKMPDRLFSGDYTADMTKYLSDQFPLRDVMVGIKGAYEIGLGKRENNGVMLVRGDTLLDREDYPDRACLSRNITAISRFAAKMEEKNIPFVMAIAGKSEDVLTDRLPPLHPQDRREALWQELNEQTGAWYLDLRETLRSHQQDGRPLYYRTDHHWTGYGAYLAYVSLCGQLGITPYAESDFRIETVTEDFYGTTWSSAGMKWVKPDTMEYYRYEGDTRFQTYIADTDTTLEGFYDLSYLEVKDKYASFLGGNNAEVRITAGEENRPKLVLVKDSFAHSVAPLLARHFDLILIDPRYYKSSVLKLAEQENAAAVAVLCNMESLTDADSYTLLLAGLGK